MKKILFFLVCAALLAACDNENLVVENDNPETVENVLPETEIFVQGQLLQAKAPTRSGLQWPYVNEEEGWETARFSIRADGTIPDYTDKSSALYFGRSPGKDGNNRGKVYSLYRYGRYNDRDLDYYQKDKKTGNNIGLFRYVYDPRGLETQLAIMEAPLVVDILGDEKLDLETAINNNQNVAKNTANLQKVNDLLDLGSDYLESHVLWYVVKEVGQKNRWHVNGVISENEVPDYTISPDKVHNEVEVDVHQQVHQDWNEIKTSLHIRADVESVTVNIPIHQEDIIEKDDFAIRVFDFDYSTYHITHKVTHDANGITIEIENIPAELIQTLKNNFGDGLTIEIHSYCTTQDIWEQLKASRVVSTGKPGTVVGQIHSALHLDPDNPDKEELVPIHVN